MCHFTQSGGVYSSRRLCSRFNSGDLQQVPSQTADSPIGLSERVFLALQWKLPPSFSAGQQEEQRIEPEKKHEGKKHRAEKTEARIQQTSTSGFTWWFWRKEASSNHFSSEQERKGADGNQAQQTNFTLCFHNWRWHCGVRLSRGESWSPVNRKQCFFLFLSAP